MNTKHTPRPWTSHYDDNGFFYVEAKGGPSPYVAATGNEGDEAEANAKLIAAAPDLLEAVQALIARIDESGIYLNIYETLITKEAIKKATL